MAGLSNLCSYFVMPSVHDHLSSIQTSLNSSNGDLLRTITEDTQIHCNSLGTKVPKSQITKLPNHPRSRPTLFLVSDELASKDRMLTYTNNCLDLSFWVFDSQEGKPTKDRAEEIGGFGV